MTNIDPFLAATRESQGQPVDAEPRAAQQDRELVRYSCEVVLSDVYDPSTDMFEDAEGDYVKYTEAAIALAEKDARIAELLAADEVRARDIAYLTIARDEWKSAYEQACEDYYKIVQQTIEQESALASSRAECEGLRSLLLEAKETMQSPRALYEPLIDKIDAVLSQPAKSEREGDVVEPFEDKWLGDGDSVHVPSTPANPAQGVSEALIADIMWRISNVHDLRDYTVRDPIERAVRAALTAVIGAGSTKSIDGNIQVEAFDDRIYLILNSDSDGLTAIFDSARAAELRDKLNLAIGAGGQAVAVKALEWEKAGKVFWKAVTYYGTYGIERQTDEIGHTFWCWFKPGGYSLAETITGYNSTLAAAKQSAQDKHDALTLSALSNPPAQPGWRLVPVEPTDEMVAAGWIDKEDVNPDEIWAAMLSAAPQPPSEGE